MKNSAWVIQKPAVGRYTPDVLAMEDRPLAALNDGEVRLKVLTISLDPSNLMWLKLEPGWMEEVKVGDIMKGPSLAIVEESKSPDFAEGDYVSGPINWSIRANISADLLSKITVNEERPLETNLSIFSHVGLAAIIGINRVAEVKSTDTVLVSAAAGATGSLACQIAKAKGCKVIGIAGGVKKCQSLIDDLGLDGAIDYRNENVAEKLLELLPEGPDVYFDNVGGEMLDSLLPHLAIQARIVVCGQISQYGLNGEPYQFKNLFYFLMRRLRMEGFVAPDFFEEAEQLFGELERLYSQKLLRHQPHILDGIEHVADGLEMLLTGANTGKLMVSLGS